MPKIKSSKPSLPDKLPDLVEEAKLGFFASPFLGEAATESSVWIIGVDEVGRGCLAGPVVAAAAVLNPRSLVDYPYSELGKRLKRKKLHSSCNPLVLSIRDSKLIPESDRAPLAEAVKNFVEGYAIAEASVQEIEELNILYASHLAMERAVHSLEEKMNRRATHVLVDGHIVPRVFLGRGIPLIKGDQRSLTIACASIIAKVYRDQMMEQLDEQFPGYGLRSHKGYPTPFHKRQILELGICSIHRKTFKGVMLDEA